MTYRLLSVALVDAIHDTVLNPGELRGRALDKSLEGALTRVNNRLLYGLIGDIFDLAATYAAAISQGRCFNDGNKRIAHQAMDTCLDLNSIQIGWSATEVGQIIIRTAQRQLDEAELGLWLRLRAP
jgi:death on curing protein